MLARRRDPDRTRERLLGAGFDEIYRHGFQAAALDTIVERAQVTKGALYHHFPSKQALGYAVLDEVIGAFTNLRWIDPIVDATDPLTAIVASMRAAFESDYENGCPLNNIAQEMSAVDEGFHARIAALYRRWEEAVRSALESGQQHGIVSPDVDVHAAAAFVVICIEGAYSLAKGRQSRAPLDACVEGTAKYLESLRLGSG
jgi:AcrR family transcriptional regulator